MTKGAQPSDRVMRFLDAAGVMKREKRNNPEKAIPRKERKAQAEAAKAARRSRSCRCRARRPHKSSQQCRAARAAVTLEFLPLGFALGKSAPRTACAAKCGCTRSRPIRRAIADYGPLETEDGRVFEIEAMRPAKDHFVARLSGIRDRDAASALANTKLYVPRERLPQTDEPDEFYHADLVGLAVVDHRRPQRSVPSSPSTISAPAI